MMDNLCYSRNTGGMAGLPAEIDGIDVSRPACFAAFLVDRGTRKPSVHTMKAYCQDFDAIVALIAGGDAGDLADVLTYSHRSISEGLVPQDYSLLLRHSDENGWQCRRQFTGDVSARGSTSLMFQHPATRGGTTSAQQCQWW
jgi:hypothetical protein